jgi:MSHA biogenesis protein MshM
VPVYLDHRTARAGAGRPLFRADAAARLYRASSGMPRLLHILAHKALLLAYGEGAETVAPRHVRLAGRDTPGAQLSWLDRWVPA